VRLTKALILVALSVGSLAAAAGAGTVREPMEDGTLSVREGRATIQLRMKGSRQRDLSGRTTIYIGTGIRFRVADTKRFAVKVAGKGLNFSAVGRGDGWIDGYGDPEDGIFFDGSYSLNGTDYPTLPNERMRFDLAAPPAGN
jgi:hypothetical protein